MDSWKEQSRIFQALNDAIEMKLDPDIDADI